MLVALLCSGIFTNLYFNWQSAKANPVTAVGDAILIKNINDFHTAWVKTAKYTHAEQVWTDIETEDIAFQTRPFDANLVNCVSLVNWEDYKCWPSI